METSAGALAVGVTGRKASDCAPAGTLFAAYGRGTVCAAPGMGRIRAAAEGDAK
ncbi:MAG: hypothetical protein ACT4OG_08960 [Alphaproteobacteria bacterium]